MRTKESKEKRRAYSKAQWEKNRKWIVELKSNTPCKDCGIQYHFCIMDFDHKDGEVKSFGIGKMSTRGKNLIEQEIAKCDLVCANCHRMRTFKRSMLASSNGKETQPITEESRFES